MARLTQKQKLEIFDAVSYRAANNELALFDLVNGKFQFPVIVKPSDIDPTFGAGRYRVQMSYRAMPLFLVRYQQGCQPDHTEVLTESQIREGYQRAPQSLYWRVMKQAMDTCFVKHLDKERIQSTCDAIRESMRAEVSHV